MRTRFWIHSTMLVAAAAIAVTLSVPPVIAQQFSPWSAPVNLNAIVLSDGTHCPAAVNSSSTDTHATISKDGLSLISPRIGPAVWETSTFGFPNATV